MTDPEREHLVDQVRVLERRLRRSHLVIVILAALLLMPLVGAGLLAVVLPGMLARERAMLMEAQARAVEAEARAQAAEAERPKESTEKGRRDTGKRAGTGKD